jgi:hypothetical protein
VWRDQAAVEQKDSQDFMTGELSLEMGENKIYLRMEANKILYPLVSLAIGSMTLF